MAGGRTSAACDMGVVPGASRWVARARGMGVGACGDKMFFGPSTASGAPPLPWAPSLSTIARPATRRRLAIAMFAIAHGGRQNGDETQHRPERSARTGAPWHTHAAMPPGTSTSRSWKIVPVGIPVRPNDEDGDDEPEVCTRCRGRAVGGMRSVASVSPMT